jgi:outer membrane receptor for ferric coprogen and ferric-rhodotorulic acid
MSNHLPSLQTTQLQLAYRRRLLPVMQAVLITCGAAFLYVAPVQSALAQTAAVQQYTVPAGPLAPALRSLASAAGVALIFTEAQTEGKTTAGVSGKLSVQDAFASLLADTGLRLVARDNGSYALAAVATSAALGASSTRTLAAINVQARRDQNGTTEGSESYTSRVTSIASKTDQSFREIPQSVSVVTRQQMDDQRIDTVAAAMTAMPGITSARVNAYTSDFYSRGFKITSMQVDGGAPLALGSYTYAPLQDMAFYDRVELMRGASGLLGGTGDPGGIINIARKKPLAERQVIVEATVNSFGGYNGMGDASSPLNEAGSLRGRGVVTYTDQSTFRDNQNSRTPAVYGVLEADLTKDTLLTVGGSYSKHKMTGTGGGLPRTFDGQDFGLSRSTNLTQPWDRVNYETKEVFAQLEHQFANRWKLKLNATHTESAVDATTSFVNGNFQHNGTGGTWWGGNYDYGNKQDVVDINLAGPFDFLGRTHELLIGADWQRVQSHWKSGLYPDRGTVPYVIGGPITSWTPDFNTPFNEIYSPWGQKQVGAYSVLRLHPTDRLHIIAGARVSRYNFDQLITYDLPSGVFEEPAYFKTATKTTPYGGVIYDFTSQWSGYVSYASIFKPQSLLMSGPPLVGTSLPPIEGKAYEAGVKGELMDGRLNATISVFKVERTGTGVSDPSYTGSFNAWGGSCCYLPQGKVTSQGLDTEIGGEVLPGLQVAAGYTYNNTRDESKNTVFSTITPKHILKLSGAWNLPGQWNKWKVGGSARVQSKAAASNSVWNGTSTTVYPFEQGGYAVFNAMVQYRFDPTWTVSLSVNNLFDKWYYDSLGSNSWYGAPRHATLALRGAF